MKERIVPLKGTITAMCHVSQPKKEGIVRQIIKKLKVV